MRKPYKDFKLREQIPRKQIDKFEELKRVQQHLGTKSDVESDDDSQSVSGKKFLGRTDFDSIMWNRERLRRARYGCKDDTTEDARSVSDAAGASAAKKLNEGKLRDWVSKCYDTIHNAHAARVTKDFERLVRGGSERNEVDILQTSNELRVMESSVSLDALTDQDDGSSSSLSEMVLRQKAISRGAADRSRSSAAETRTRWDNVGRKRPDNHLKVHEGVNFVLEDFYIEDLKELKSLAYDEELYAYDKTNGQIVGSWRVNTKVCEDKDDCINVQFEGLVGEPEHSNWVMCSHGIVDRTYTPITEFRVEQNIKQSGASCSKIMFFHKKKRKWMFDVRETAGKGETRKTFSEDHQGMQRVLTESAHLLLVRKAIMYHYPLSFEDKDDDYQHMPCPRVCVCTETAGGCACTVPLKIRKKYRLKMRAITIGGDIVRCNYRFYAPVNVKFHQVELKVVRVRRRVEMPGKLIQTSNYFITTAGQLMAVTFNDPYPYETNYYLQIDPKSVLDPSRVVPPERIVPLRERYMCDPELRQFYESEVHRFMTINQTYMNNAIREVNGVKAVFQDLLNDKPHRIHDYVKDFFFEGYRVVGKTCVNRSRRRQMKKSKDEDDTWTK